MSLERAAPRAEPASLSPAQPSDWRAALVALFAGTGLAGAALDWREGGEAVRVAGVGRCEGRPSEVLPLLTDVTGRLNLCLHGRTLGDPGAEAALVRLEAACRAQVAFEDRVIDVVSEVLASGGRQILLCRSSGALLESASAATSPLEGSGLISRAGRLSAEDPRDEFGLRQALRAAGLEGQRRRLAMASGGQRVFVEVRPVLRPPEALRPVAVVLPPRVRPPQAERCEVLQRLFGLTSAEAAIGVAIADGVRVEDIARARDVAVSTVRSQVKTVLHKAGVSRQVELVQRIAEAG
jgi:DNA-binding CsgD family transcriptional regulator